MRTAENSTKGTSPVETDKIRLMLMSLGGSVEPLIESINTYRPEKVIFFASHASVPLSHEILCSVGKKPDSEFVVTDNPNSLLTCYTKARECIERVHDSGMSADEIMVDYTGGTKVMTAALLLASLGRSYKFNYVGGVVRNKDGLGTVVDGHETMFTEASPWAVFAEEERRQVATLFNCQRYSAVIDILSSIKRELPHKIRQYFDFVLPLAKGFLFWDQFVHKAARRHLEKGIVALETYLAIYPDSDLARFLEQARECKGRLDNLLARTKEANRYDPAMITDLLNNARRKMADKRFDDAAARVYRALELYGQIRFREVAKCDNSKVKPSVIPDSLRDEFGCKYYDPYKKYLKLPLTATFEYLRAMGDEAGIRFFKKEKEIKNIQSNRNFSILAHGIKPVGEKAAKSIFDTVSSFVEETDFFDFPKLP